MTTKTKAEKAKSAKPANSSNSSKSSKSAKPDKQGKPRNPENPCKQVEDDCAALGAMLARSAIHALEAAEAKARKEEYKHRRDVDEFLAECTKAAMNPVDVVKQVADANFIDLAKSNPDETPEQRSIRNLLVSVLIKFVIDAASFAAGEVSGGNHDWKMILHDYIDEKIGGVFNKAGSSSTEKKDATSRNCDLDMPEDMSLRGYAGPLGISTVPPDVSFARTRYAYPLVVPFIRF